MLYSPGGEVSLQGAAHRLLQPAKCLSYPGHRRPAITSAEHRRVTTRRRRQSCWPRWLKWPRSGVCPSSAEAAAAAALLFLSLTSSRWSLLRSLVLSSSSSRLHAFNSRTQPTVEYHLLALQAPSSRYSCMRQWGRETVSTCLQPMSLHVCILQSGSYRSAHCCQFQGLMKYSPEG